MNQLNRRIRRKPASLTKGLDTQKTVAFRDRLRIGAAIADQMPKLMGAKECAAKLGISATMLRRLECLALFKVSSILKIEHANLKHFRD